MKNNKNKGIKKITAYVNTTRIHWLVEELQKQDINEIMVTEYFRPDSQISKFEFLCPDIEIENIKDIIHSLGTCGNAVDHYISVNNAENIKSIFPLA